MAAAIAPFFMPASGQRQRPVIVAMAAMDMVEPAIDQPVDMITVRHRFMTAARAVDMATGHGRHAAIGIAGRNRHDMIIDMIAMDMMEMTIMEIIDMAIMAHGGVATAGAMGVGMIGVDVTGHDNAS